MLPWFGVQNNAALLSLFIQFIKPTNRETRKVNEAENKKGKSFVFSFSENKFKETCVIPNSHHEISLLLFPAQHMGASIFNQHEMEKNFLDFSLH